MRDTNIQWQSIWKSGVRERPAAHRLTEDIKADALVIGGGMAGVLCAHWLRRAGASCVLVEGGRLGGGITGNTTAKITAQHALIYDNLIRTSGISQARQYYDAHQDAVEQYAALAQTIPCDFERKTAYAYTTSDPKKLMEEAEAYRVIGAPYRLLDKPPLPIDTLGALGMENQAQFHPLKLLYGVAQGLTVYENTFVSSILDGVAQTDHGSVKAEYIVLATHFPMVNMPGLYFMKLTQSRSYVIAVENGPQIGGMFIDEKENGYSFRNYGGHLLVGGGGDKNGARCGGYEELLALVKRSFPQKRVTHGWAAQDCMSLDGIPYAGRHRHGKTGLYVATGFNKWGMTGSMAASKVLADLIISGRSEYEALFSPARSMMHAKLWSNLASSAINLIRPGKRCSHMGCALKWNPVERTWDCPCHGSRFAQDGGVIDNPAMEPIKP